LNEGVDVRVLDGFPYIMVALLCEVAKEWNIPHLGGGLQVPFLRVPRKPIIETRFKNPKERGLGE
jgi:hypothetical protein